jgi:hypothetical protein
VGAAGETPTMGVAVESRTDAHSTSRLARWFIVGTRAGVAPLGEWCGRAEWYVQRLGVGKRLHPSPATGFRRGDSRPIVEHMFDRGPRSP